MIKKNVLICFFILISITQLHGIIYQIDIYKSPEGAMTYLCRDEHNSCSDDEAGNKQFQAITKILKAYNNKAKIILECNIDYQGNDPALQLEAHNSRSAASSFDDIHLLTTLFSYCKKENITCTNIDHRFFNELSMAGAAPAKSVLRSFDESVKEIEAFTTQALKPFYQEIIKQAMIGKKKYFINYLKKHSNKTLKQIEKKQKTQEGKDKFHEDVERFGHDFLDARLINQLALHTSSDPIMAFVGGNHIDNIESQLPLIGYTHMGTLGHEPEYDENNEECITTESLFDINEFTQAIAGQQKPEGLTQKNVKKRKNDEPAAAAASSSSSAASPNLAPYAAASSQPTYPLTQPMEDTSTDTASSSQFPTAEPAAAASSSKPAQDQPKAKKGRISQD
ncbi:MAG: hypothetical protein P4L31_07950 [Candidatus Babeliales bacterium]|nr:hypothetical protein [Candidatus Babeliales bacterium]